MIVYPLGPTHRYETWIVWTYSMWVNANSRRGAVPGGKFLGLFQALNSNHRTITNEKITIKSPISLNLFTKRCREIERTIQTDGFGLYEVSCSALQRQNCEWWASSAGHSLQEKCTLEPKHDMEPPVGTLDTTAFALDNRVCKQNVWGVVFSWRRLPEGDYRMLGNHFWKI